MTTVLVDFCFFKGHRQLNNQFINYLSQLTPLAIIAEQGYYSRKRMADLGVTLVEFPHYTAPFNNRLTYRTEVLANMLRTLKTLPKMNCEKIFVMGFETTTLALFAPLFYRKAEVSILHHHNIDELASPYKLRLFKQIMNKVNHIVLEDFIRSHLVMNIGVDPAKVFTVPLPTLKPQEAELLSSKKSAITSVIAISSSNDEEQISSLVKDVQSSRIKIPSSMQIIVKSQTISYEGKGLKVFQGYLTDEDYAAYYRHCDIVWLPFSKSYRYRMSASIVDALSNNKIVAGPPIPCIEALQERYPMLCKTIQSWSELAALVKPSEQDETVQNAFETFREAHSQKAVTNALEIALISSTSVE